MNENVFVIADNTEERRKDRWKEIMTSPSNRELVDLHIGPKLPDGGFTWSWSTKTPSYSHFKGV